MSRLTLFRTLSWRPAALILATTATVVGGGCAQQTPAYSWSHGSSGEYLFAFDTQECSEQDSSNLDPAEDAFFSCMKSRGYFLVDTVTREPLADGGESVVLMMPGFTQAGR